MNDHNKKFVVSFQREIEEETGVTVGKFEKHLLVWLFGATP
ncbi:hypothetical protein PthstB1num2_36030 [Parageobacillus thermoglucosidasius]|nr:hypothetical protein PTHTG4_22270 [Parageobacillus thermoglucosidasius]GMO01563.1 hypothetical protein PthstB1num2_36030 [Parageobacillus thermoglucosidasius]